MNISIADLKFNFVYFADGERKTSDCEENEDFRLELTKEKDYFTLELIPKKELRFETFEVFFEREYSRMERLFVNGYQSWTVSREYAPEGRMDEFQPRVLGLEKKKINPRGVWGAGDLLFHDYPEEDGVFYGYTYGYVRSGEQVDLYASLEERTGFTCITFDVKCKLVKFEKDFEGVTFAAPGILMTMFCITDSYDAAFDRYFAQMNVPKPHVKRAFGYTTWYNYYTNITEDIVQRDLTALANLRGKRADFFQIDDGYERTVGDWLEYDRKKFPNGMRAAADNIHRCNMRAGLWLAPFAATPKSKIYKEHKDWLVRDKNGKLRFASHNWGGFYALDIYNLGVRQYLKEVFHTVLHKWGYDMVKLDFLYACCITPIYGKSRGEIMDDAMAFLRECCGDKIILGCGVPLAPAFGRVDYCRVGADIGLCWENKAFSREDVSTQHALLNTVFRRHLDGRAFLNDPDVFLLRDENMQMNPAQRALVAKVNSLCGSLLFVSDNVADYTPQQKKLFLETVSAPKAKILSAAMDIDDNITIEYWRGGNRETLTFNIKTGYQKQV